MSESRREYRQAAASMRILGLASACLLALGACSGKGGASAGTGSGPPTDAEVVAAYKARVDRANAGQSGKMTLVSVTNPKCTPMADPSKYDCELEVETQMPSLGAPVKGTSHALLEKIDGEWTTNQDVPS